MLCAIVFLVAVVSGGVANPRELPDLDQPTAQADGNELERRLSLEIERAKAPMVEAEANRLSLIERALEFSRQEKEEAKTEREQVERQKARLQHLNEVRSWALGRFEPGKRGLLPKLNTIPRMHAQWEQSRERWTRHFLTATDQTKGAVRSGRALNLFLDLCGPVAIDQELLRQQVEEELKQLKPEQSDLERRLETAAPDLRDPLRERLNHVNEKIAAAELRQNTLSCVGGRRFLTPYHRNRVRFQRGILGSKLIVEGHNKAFPLDWPELLVADTVYEPHRLALEQARETALRELRDGQGISTNTERSILYAVDGINAEFQKYRQAYHSTREHDAVDNQRYFHARYFVDGLRSQVVRFVAAEEIGDVELEEKFYGETIEELLAYMVRNGLRFPEADLTSADTYHAIYTQQVGYYLGLHSLQLAVETTERDVAHADRKIEELMDIQYRDTMDAVVTVLQTGPPPLTIRVEKDRAGKFAEYVDIWHKLIDGADKLRTLMGAIFGKN